MASLFIKNVKSTRIILRFLKFGKNLVYQVYERGKSVTKGQIVILKDIRRKMSLKPGDKVKNDYATL